MSSESVHKKLTRVRPPRVQISYEVHVGDAIQLKEIPFVLGVLGDFTGNPVDALPEVRERKFVEVNPDNFDDVLASMKPHLRFSVENKLSDQPNASKLGVDLSFKSLDDFGPEQVAMQIEPLKDLLALRRRLADLRGNLQTNQTLDDQLQLLINSSEKMQKLRTQREGSDTPESQENPPTTEGGAQ
jgi:type VI secretion system protein ImpB